MRKKKITVKDPAALLSSCGGGNEFTVSGTVENAKNETLMLERSVSGRWLRIDSIKTNSDGEFKFSEEAPAFPEIFRLERGGKYIYFPIDSLDNVTITADTANFDTNYRLAGTNNAIWMMQVDSISRELAKLPADAPAFAEAKAAFAERILVDPSSIVAYYVVNKIIGTTPLYQISDRDDVKIIGAVANAYNSYKPNDPRTEYLKRMFFAGRNLTVKPKTVASGDTIVLEESQILEVELFDKNGKLRKLSEETSKGKVLLLNFTTYMAAESPALNAQLAQLYKKYAANGFEIFQIGYDENEFTWKDAAKNLPWITVYDPSGAQSQNLLQYNVGTLPALFVINRNGELSERVLDLADLDKTIGKYM